MPNTPQRYFGLDVHKHYLIATAVEANLNKVYGPRRVELVNLEDWIQKTITSHDAVVLEMTANAWQLHDELAPPSVSIMVWTPTASDLV
jgi:hypothetical protein